MMLAFGWYPISNNPDAVACGSLLFIQRGIMYSRIPFLSHRLSYKVADYLLLSLSSMTLLISLCIWLDPVSASFSLLWSS